MAKAIWNDVVIAESNETVMVEGNHYFPPASLKSEYFTMNSKTSSCHWKGKANYYDIDVNGKVNSGGAWVYQAPLEKAQHIKDYVAFWGGVKVEA